MAEARRRQSGKRHILIIGNDVSPMKTLYEAIHRHIASMGVVATVLAQTQKKNESVLYR
jgi:hypothetical protein